MYKDLQRTCRTVVLVIKSSIILFVTFTVAIAVAVCFQTRTPECQNTIQGFAVSLYGVNKIYNITWSLSFATSEVEWLYWSCDF